MTPDEETAFIVEALIEDAGIALKEKRDVPLLAPDNGVAPELLLRMADGVPVEHHVRRLVGSLGCDRETWLQRGREIVRRRRDPDWDKLQLAIGADATSTVIVAAHALWIEVLPVPGGVTVRAALLNAVPRLQLTVGDRIGDRQAAIVAAKHALSMSAAKALVDLGRPVLALALDELVIDEFPLSAVRAQGVIPDVTDPECEVKAEEGTFPWYALVCARAALGALGARDYRACALGAIRAAMCAYVDPLEALAVLDAMASAYRRLRPPTA